jgi:dTDP-4-dehydrorhamnose 3,5-epimerase
MYLHDASYAPASEDGVNPLDTRLSIDWPLPIGEMSVKDRTRPILPDTFKGIP